VLLLVHRKNEQPCGALIEASAVLAAGRRAFVVSPDAWTFSRHPNCRKCSALVDAVVAIVAMQAGESGKGMRGYSASTSGTNSPYSSSWPGNPPQRVEPERGDIDTVVVDSLKALDLEWPIREADMPNRQGAVAGLVGIEGGVVSGVFNLESSGVEASDWSSLGR
jgi:hypothetical protein